MLHTTSNANRSIDGIAPDNSQNTFAPHYALYCLLKCSSTTNRPLSIGQQGDTMVAVDGLSSTTPPSLFGRCGYRRVREQKRLESHRVFLQEPPARGTRNRKEDQHGFWCRLVAFSFPFRSFILNHQWGVMMITVMIRRFLSEQLPFSTYNNKCHIIWSSMRGDLTQVRHWCSSVAFPLV